MLINSHTLTPYKGTLVVVIPTSEGFVVAADKRASPSGIYCDGVAKILIAKQPNTAVFVTGLASLRDTSTIPLQDLCRVLADTPAPIDFGRSTLAFLERQSSPMQELSGQALTEVIYPDVKPYIEGGQLRDLMGQQRIATIVILNFDPVTSSSRLWAFWVNFTGPFGFQLQPQQPPLHYRPDNLPDVQPFGENEYLLTHVLNGVGRQFLDGSYEAVRSKPAISQVSAIDASKAAINWIEAATKSSELVKPPSGIGGGIDCLLLGRETKVLK